MNKVIEQAVAFLKANPNSNKATIGETVGLKGLPLFNLLKKMQTDGLITIQGEGADATYSLIEPKSESVVAEAIVETNPEPVIVPLEEVVNGNEQMQPIVETAVLEKAGSRDNSKYKFNGEEYGKGPLVRAVVAKYIEENPGTTHKELKDIFPDTLMKRFGVFADYDTAVKLSGSKPRYFMKPEQLIKIKGQKAGICICNQWTAKLLSEFLALSKRLGYKVSVVK